MKKVLFLLMLVAVGFKVFGQPKTIHVFVALCDNENQGIVPVPAKIGNGKDPFHNLYWGAGYGLKNFFDKKTKDWQLIKSISSDRSEILERLLFKHSTKNVYLLADAYDGATINMYWRFLKGFKPSESRTDRTEKSRTKFWRRS